MDSAVKSNLAVGAPRQEGQGRLMTITCEKTGPMRWMVHVPGREPFLYCVYAIVHDGVEHTETFTARVAVGVAHG